METDFLEFMEFYEQNRNLQCFKCSGWAIECPCEENQFNKSEKAEITKMIKELF